jgi:hypothetical protein
VALRRIQYTFGSECPIGFSKGKDSISFIEKHFISTLALPTKKEGVYLGTGTIRCKQPAEK